MHYQILFTLIFGVAFVVAAGFIGPKFRAEMEKSSKTQIWIAIIICAVALVFRRSIALLLLVLGQCLVPGCSSTSEPASGDLGSDLRHPDPRIRMQSAVRAADSRRTDLLLPLVENLSDRDESVRFFSAIALRRLTGEDLGYRSFDPEAVRSGAVERWRKWVAAHPSGDAPADLPAGSAARPHLGGEGPPPGGEGGPR